MASDWDSGSDPEPPPGRPPEYRPRHRPERRAGPVSDPASGSFCCSSCRSFSCRCPWYPPVLPCRWLAAGTMVRCRCQRRDRIRIRRRRIRNRSHRHIAVKRPGRSRRRGHVGRDILLGRREGRTPRLGRLAGIRRQPQESSRVVQSRGLGPILRFIFHMRHRGWVRLRNFSLQVAQLLLGRIRP